MRHKRNIHRSTRHWKRAGRTWRRRGRRPKRRQNRLAVFVVWLIVFLYICSLSRCSQLSEAVADRCIYTLQTMQFLRMYSTNTQYLTRSLTYTECPFAEQRGGQPNYHMLTHNRTQQPCANTHTGTECPVAAPAAGEHRGAPGCPHRAARSGGRGGGGAPGGGGGRGGGERGGAR